MTDDTPEVVRPDDCGNSPKAARAQDIALALMGAGSVDPTLFAPDAQWQRPKGPAAGRQKIVAALKRTTPPEKIEVEQVVTHGRSGSVSGRYWLSPGDERLFCHVIRYSSAACREVAQLVSFEHRVRHKD